MDLSIIIPICSTADAAMPPLEKALNSIKYLNNGDNYTVIVAGNKDNIDKFREIYNAVKCPQVLKTVIVEDTDYAEIINNAVMACLTPYFSVIEVDDLFANYWFECVDEYINNNNDYSCYLPINELLKDGEESVGFANEIVWGASFNDDDKLGEVLLSSLKLHKDFCVAGSVIKTEDFISVGKLDKEMGPLAWNEYLVRSVKNGKQAFVIPTVGYYHNILRSNTLTESDRKAITSDKIQEIIDKIENLF